jgi:uncharacterized membrane protein YjgN (DUF898 family)
MATADVLPAPAPILPRARGREESGKGAVAFLGNEGAYWRLRLRGAVLVAVTLGLYRFWLATEVRRFLWANTEIAGDTLEYNGLATELLGGFLLAIAILAPLYTVFAIAALADGIALTSVALGLALMAVLGEFALYRARRYRLTRTVFRGVRFDQYGSAWNYAARALAWWVVVIATLGLAYPWAQASLQRFKMRNTCYGDLPGRFEGSGLALFWRGLPIWLLVMAPLLVAFAVLSGMLDWDTLSNAVANGDDDAMEQLIEADPRLGVAAGIAMSAVLASLIAVLALFPLFQALMMRWWISGLRFGALTVNSRLKARRVYRIYLRFFLYVLLLGLAALLAGVGCLVAIGVVLPSAGGGSLGDVAASVLTVALYVAVVLGASTIYQVVVTAAMWRLALQSAELAGADVLDNVRATGAAASALGEGLADALGVGGM